MEQEVELSPGIQMTDADDADYFDLGRHLWVAVAIAAAFCALAVWAFGGHFSWPN